MGRLANAKSAVEEVGLNPFTIRRLGYSGKISVFRYGSAVRYDVDEIRDLMRKAGHEHPVMERARAKK